MSSLNSSMVITSKGLSSVSKKIINTRDFDSSKINIIGSPLILNGEASGLSESNYFVKAGLEFSEDISTELEFKGIYSYTNQTNMCAWSLTSEAEILTLNVNYNSISLVSSNLGIITEIRNISLNKGDSIRVRVKLATDSCSITAFINNTLVQDTKDVSSLRMSAYSTLYLGINPRVPSNFWAGNISVKEFRILKGNEEYYSPSTGISFEFTKLLVSNGSVPLTDSSGPILNKIAECRITEIIRTNNNILLKADIDESITMNIKEAGLYCNVNGSQILFSLIQNLSIDKSIELSYSLILHAKLDLNVVNTTIRPLITIEDVKNPDVADFEVIKKSYVDSISSIERLIKGNALGLGNYNSKDDLFVSPEIETLKNFEDEPVEVRKMTDVKGNGIGYNKSQVLYKLNNKIREEKDGYSAALSYSLIKKRCNLKQRLLFDYSAVVLQGNVGISNEGVASGFDDASYVKMNAYNENNSSFKMELSFRATEYTVNKETICCLVSDCINNPMEVSIKGGILHVGISQLEKLVAFKDGYQCTFIRGAHTEVVDSKKYYVWNYEGEIQGIPASLYTLKKEPMVGDTMYYMSGGALVASEISFSYHTSGILFSTNLARINLGSITKVRIVFDGNYYKFYVAENSGNCVLKRTFMSPISMNSVSQVLFGISNEDSEEKNPFSGEIFLKEFLFETKLSTFKLVKKAEEDIAEIKDFYHFPLINRNFVKVANLSSNDKFLIKENENFVGDKDSVDFSRTDGFSLCLKVNLRDTSDKLIIAKANKGSNVYFFRFEIISSVLMFTIFFDEQEVVLTKEITEENKSKFITSPVLFTILRANGTYEGLYKLYLNEECISTVLVPELLTQDSSSGYLINYINEPTKENYVQDIISFDGGVTEDDIHFLCSILDSRV